MPARGQTWPTKILPESNSRGVPAGRLVGFSIYMKTPPEEQPGTEQPSPVARLHRERLKTSYTLFSLFRNCRKAAWWRYIEKIVPLERDRNLRFGSLVHECLEHWHRDRQLGAVLAHIDASCPNRAHDEEQRRMWHLATAMMKGYA